MVRSERLSINGGNQLWYLVRASGYESARREDADGISTKPNKHCHSMATMDAQMSTEFPDDDKRARTRTTTSLAP